MDSKNQDFLAMCLKVRNHFSASMAFYNGINGLPDLIAQFNPLVDKLMQLDVAATDDVSGVTLQKAAKRERLEQLALRISSAISAYAVVNNDSVLAKKCSYPSSIFYQLSEEELVTRCKSISLLAAPLNGQLDGYNADANSILDLETALNDFVLEMPNPSLAIDERKETRSEVFTAIDEIRSLLNEKLDVVVRVTETLDPHTYGLYLSARAIDNTTSPSAPLASAAAPGGITVALKQQFEGGAVLRFVNTGTVPLIFSLSPDGTSDGPELLTVEPGNSRVRQVQNLNPVGEHFMVRNDAETVGAYKIYLA